MAEEMSPPMIAFADGVGFNGSLGLLAAATLTPLAFARTSFAESLAEDENCVEDEVP